MSKKGLMEQDLSKLDVTKLHPLSPKVIGDSYSLGVVLLELATGQKPLGVSTADEGFKGNLVDRVIMLSNFGRIKDGIDKRLYRKGHDEEIVRETKFMEKTSSQLKAKTWP
ncbi:unnamed protein product [Fraxinus pennsylvanica]|uniref:Protein kinase domain-containing protein n=1 Tax=Fraxinus pennsylvanica TaxID=56036 RepID=A0AAD2DXG5_9LAMI|nr:unnamed protein product [Fraxinus pennsylvanica]